MLAACCLAAAAPNPFDQSVTALEPGDVLPADSFTDQAGQAFHFSQLRGNTTLVGFIYTRCTDACPLITQKFTRLQRSLAGGPYRYVEASIDPARDTVPAIATYARRYGVRLPGWFIITGSAAEMSHLWRAAGVSVIDNGRGDLIHNDRLIIVAADGHIADIIDAVGWSPAEVGAQMRHIAGRSANPFARADLALTNIVAQFCGGSYRTASGIVDALTALVLLGLASAVFYFVGRRIFVPGG